MNVRALVLAAAVAVAAGAVGVGYAAIPAANGTISACKDSKGSLKVIDDEAGQACAGNQQLLTWNQQGQPGPGRVSGYEFVSAESVKSTNPTKVVALYCPPGKKVLGAGFRVTGFCANVG